MSDSLGGVKTARPPTIHFCTAPNTQTNTLAIEKFMEGMVWVEKKGAMLQAVDK